MFQESGSTYNTVETKRMVKEIFTVLFFYEVKSQKEFKFKKLQNLVNMINLGDFN